MAGEAAVAAVAAVAAWQLWQLWRLAASVAAELTGRNVSIVMDIETNMQMLGGRRPFDCTYTLGVQVE